MKKLILGSFLIMSFSFGLKSTEPVKVQKTDSYVLVCGTTPGGQYGCVGTYYNDGWDCLIIDNEGAPNGLWIGCDM